MKHFESLPSWVIYKLLPGLLVVLCAWFSWTAYTSIGKSKESLSKQWATQQEVTSLSALVPANKAVKGSIESVLGTALQKATWTKDAQSFTVRWTKAQASDWIKVVELAQKQLGSKPMSMNMKQNEAGTWDGSIQFSWRD